MKVTLDLNKLLAEGQITVAEYDKLLRLGARDTGSLAINILIGFGVIAVSGAALALMPSAYAAGALGVVLLGLGLGLLAVHAQQWTVLANILMLVGALMLSGGIVYLGEGSLVSFLLVALVLAVSGVFARSALLIAGAVLALSCCLGARTGYLHAMYFFGMKEPTLSILAFSALALVTYVASRSLSPDLERLALAASRTSVFLVNLGFWIGSLWGDRVGRSFGNPMGEGQLFIPDWAFAVVWALALAAAGLWAMQVNRRWLVNVVAVFGAIHFYTQFFERLGATPATVLVAGLLTLVLAFALWKFNERRAALV